MTGIEDQLREQAVDTALGRIRLQIGGAGSPIVFWPSLLMTGDMWHGVAGHLMVRRQVILVDPPGQGGSQPLTHPFSFDDCARCVADILDGLGIQRADFVGNSWGGMIGGTFAATFPDRVGRAVLMNCTAGKASLRQRIEFAILLQMAHWQGRIGPSLIRPVLKAFLGPTSMRERPDVVAHVRATVHDVNIASASWAVKSVVPRRPDQRELLSRIRTPVLVVGGAEDKTFPPRDAVAMADAIPGASVRVLDGVAHLSGLEDPALVSRLIEEFLDDGESGPTATG
ncbi:alpha/beta fold hydrolase [Mycobacterium cookii]|uniref:Putative hydrolase, alpha/beta fold protein n=1 Tax=Mycobacterium cookii TaxID=1775 RepID=A0A7I7L3G6_9MYCO|nr:alpha/beta hydrolase [Mycobacterium cookii]MCV7329252.1 alpha/beta fold hydrolase [Mycobacterium cookii]BBX48915.1 putative hydrolase, alpha/beta fold protein [Mycobacterium cookii]